MRCRPFFSMFICDLHAELFLNGVNHVGLSPTEEWYPHRVLSCFQTYLFPLFGFSGNQPFFTRSRCLKSSRIDHKLENAVTPSRVDNIVLSTSSDPPMHSNPNTRNVHQQPTPKYYSALITNGWKRPIHKKVATPIIRPVKFISRILS